MKICLYVAFYVKVVNHYEYFGMNHYVHTCVNIYKYINIIHYELLWLISL